jgi:polyhydroxybutyrate depolymerase
MTPGARLRERMLARAGASVPGGLDEVTIDVAGRRRTYRLAAPAQPGAPLVVALHGAGGTGLGMAALTGLAGRAPKAGIAAAFPDGWGRVWNDGRGASRLARREGIDDVAFLGALIERLAAERVADPAAVHLVGISNGALLAEHIARHARLPVAGVVLVAGAATARSRQAAPRPGRPTSVLMLEGTADPIVPYAGGPIGPAGRAAGRRARRGWVTGGQRRAGRLGGGQGRGQAVGAETVAADWVAANGITTPPIVDRLAGGAQDLPVVRTTWTEPGRPPVVLYRVEGGGHTWPGGPQYLPARFVGPVAGLDATGIVVDAVARRGEQA